MNKRRSRLGVLAALRAHPDEFVSTETLMTEGLGYSIPLGAAYVIKMHIHYLRRDGYRITNARGIGYRLDGEP